MHDVSGNTAVLKIKVTRRANNTSYANAIKPRAEEPREVASLHYGSTARAQGRSAVSATRKTEFLVLASRDGGGDNDACDDNETELHGP